MSTSNRQNLALQFAAETAHLDERAFLQRAVKTFGNQLAFATSLGAEDQVLLHQLVNYPEVDIFTLDTGRLPPETYDVLAASTQKYGRRIRVLFPDASAVEDLVASKGINLFYDSVENRKACCHVRKVQPLEKHLKGFRAWMTGMRRQQSSTRTQVARVEYDAAHDLIKLNPLIEWDRQAVWDYIKAHQIPYNALHDRGYPSLGCAPCTRAIKAGEEERAGRWWWEQPEHKECGLHVQPAAKSFSFKPIGS